MKLFLDTAPLIYVIENHPEFAQRVIDLLSDSLANGDTFTTSVITITEFGVKPERENKEDIIQQFRTLLNEMNTQIVDINEAIATKAYQFRAKYQFLKGMDSIQMAAAIVSDCDLFITNDKKLKNVNDIEVLLIAD